MGKTCPYVNGFDTKTFLNVSKVQLVDSFSTLSVLFRGSSLRTKLFNPLISLSVCSFSQEGRGTRLRSRKWEGHPGPTKWFRSGTRTEKSGYQ